jgi:hypothetical protein
MAASTASTTNYKFKVTTISDGSDGRVVINLITVSDPNTPNFQSPLTLNLTSAEAKAAGYWPGLEFDLTINASA